MFKKIIILTFALFAIVGIQADNGKLSNKTKMVVNLNREAKTTSVNRLKQMGYVTHDNMVSAFVRVDNNYVTGTIERYGGVVRHNYESLGIMTVNLPVDAIEALAAEECILSVEVASPAHTQMNSARVVSHVEEMIAGKSPLGHGYMGDSVIVGIVDVEFQPGHINFYSSDQSRYRVRKFWRYAGMVYSDSASIIAAGYDTAHLTSGHGTHVLGIAAGADHTRNYYGTAQNSDLLIVETTGTTADMTEGVREMFAYADSVGKPCVVNISMGHDEGPHDGTGIEAQIYKSLIGPGHLIVASAGNRGDTHCHVGKTITNGDSLKTLIKGNPAWIDVWGDADMDYRLSFGIYSAYSNSIVYSTPYYNALLDSTHSVRVDTTFAGSTDDVNINVEITTLKNIYNDKGNIYMSWSGLLPDSFYICLVAKGEPGTINMWTDEKDIWTGERKSSFTDLGMAAAGWSDGDAMMTIGSGLADVENVITVGSYCSRIWEKEQPGVLSFFSSHGPTADGRTKPEITAPGSIIVSSVPASEEISMYYVDSTTVGGETYYYALDYGTSMSSPYCAGVIAAWLEAKPDLTYDDVVDVFEHTAIQDQFTGSNLPDNLWGYGKLDAFNGLLYLLNLPPSGSENVASSAKNKLFGYFDGTSAHLAGIAGDVTIRVYDISGKLVYSEIHESLTPGTEFTVNLSNQPAGVYVINVNGESLKVVR